MYSCSGTNGKGSVCHILSAIAQTSGLKQAYIHHHLLDYRERIRVTNQYIPKAYVQSFIKKVKHLIVEEASFFELTVALAFDYFYHQQVDIANRNWLGAFRFDKCNSSSLFSIITNIGLEHDQMLGETLDKIAFEKAGIIKKNRPCIIGVTQKETAPVFEKKTKENSKIFCRSRI